MVSCPCPVCENKLVTSFIRRQHRSRYLRSLTPRPSDTQTDQEFSSIVDNITATTDSPRLSLCDGVVSGTDEGDADLILSPQKVRYNTKGVVWKAPRAHKYNFVYTLLQCIPMLSLTSQTIVWLARLTHALSFVLSTVRTHQ